MKETRPGVVVLYNVTDSLVTGEERDLLAERSVIEAGRRVRAALERLGWRVADAPYQRHAEDVLAPYPPSDWMVFNLAEGAEGRLFEEARIAWVLEAKGYRFTGNRGDALALSTHKARAKGVLQAAGVPTPPWWVFRAAAEVGQDYPFPLFVKPVAEDASIGIGPEAVTFTPQALRERVEYINQVYRQAALAETFIVGREFAITVWDDPPQVLPLYEKEFGAATDPYARFVSYTTKWDEGSWEYQQLQVTCPANVTPAVGERIRRAALDAFQAIGCRGYARMDIRLSTDEIPYVIEVNCNPELYDGVASAASVAGYTWDMLIARILAMALQHE